MKSLILVLQEHYTDEQVDKFDKEMNQLLVDLTPEENSACDIKFYDTKNLDLLNSNRWISVDEGDHKIALNTYSKLGIYVQQHIVSVDENYYAHIKNHQGFDDINDELFETISVSVGECFQQVSTKNQGVCWLTFSYYRLNGNQIVLISIVPSDETAEADLKEVEDVVIKNHSDVFKVDNREHYNILMDYFGKENVKFDKKINDNMEE